MSINFVVLLHYLPSHFSPQKPGFTHQSSWRWYKPRLTHSFMLVPLETLNSIYKVIGFLFCSVQPAESIQWDSPFWCYSIECLQSVDLYVPPGTVLVRYDHLSCVLKHSYWQLWNYNLHMLLFGFKLPSISSGCFSPDDEQYVSPLPPPRLPPSPLSLSLFLSSWWRRVGRVHSTAIHRSSALYHLPLGHSDYFKLNV